MVSFWPGRHHIGRMREGITVEASAADRARLEAVAVDRNSPQKHVWRARIILAAAEGLGTSPLAVSLAWVRDRPGVSSSILGARTVGQLSGSLAADATVLPAEIRHALDDVSAPPLGYPEQ